MAAKSKPSKRQKTSSKAGVERFLDAEASEDDDD